MTPIAELIKPQIANRFAVRYSGALLTVADGSRLSTATLSTHVDLKNKTIELALQQTISVEMFGAVQEFLLAPRSVELDFMLPSGEVSGTIEYSGIEVTGHSFQMTYMSSQPTNHFITLAFKRAGIINALKR